MDVTTLKNAAFIVIVLLLSSVCAVGLAMWLGQNTLSPLTMVVPALG